MENTWDARVGAEADSAQPHWIASIDAMAIGVTDAIGSLNRTLPLPNVPALIHGKLFHQALVRSPKTNALGLVFSNGVAVTIGGEYL